jgi:hypothetical protein
MVERGLPPLAGRTARAPFGVASVAVAGVASLPVWFFDEIEGRLGDAMPEGPRVLLAIVGIFAAVWFLVGGAILALVSPRPDREGLLAGAIVALLMLAILVGDGDLPWQIVLIVWAIFGSLAVGCGAVAGLFGLRLQGRTRGPGRAAAVAALGSAVVIGVVVLSFFPPAGGIALFVLALLGVLAGSGVWWLLRAPAEAGR